MQEQLLRRIREVAKRYRWQRFWRFGFFSTLGLLIVSVAALYAAYQTKLPGESTAMAIGGAALICWLIAWVTSSFSFRNLRWVATQIESKHPTLSQRLLTALTLLGPINSRGRKTLRSRQTGPEPKLGYLQRRVIEETQKHARTHAWNETVSTRQLRLNKLGGLLSTSMLVGVMALLVTSDQGEESLARLRQKPLRDVQVEPGNTEIERGSGLTVSARFNRSVPANAELVVVDDEGTSQTLRMSRNLSDPVFGTFVTSTQRPFTYQVRTLDWLSDPFRVDVFDFPALVRSDANLSFPEYTQLDSRKIEDCVRVSAVEGSKLTWECTLNKEVETAELIDESGNVISMTRMPDGSGRRQAEFTLTNNQKWNLRLVDAQQRENKTSIQLSARVLPNKPAEIKLVGAKDVSVSPLQELPLAADVQDDFGVVRSGLSYTFNGAAEEEIVLGETQPANRKHRLQQLIEFESLNAQPDQLLAYYFWAEDYDGQGNLRRTLSDLFFADVRPFEEIFRQGEAPPGGQTQQPPSQNAQQAEQLLELQKQIVTATFNQLRQHVSSKLPESAKPDLEVIGTSQLDAAEQLQTLMQDLRDGDAKSFAEAALQSMASAAERLEQASNQRDRSSLEVALTHEQAAYQSLLKLRAREFEISRSRQSQSSSSSASQAQRQQMLDELELENDDNRYETQSEAAQSPEDQEGSENRQILNRLKDLARRQADLNEQLAQLQSALEQADDDEAKEEIERRLKRLREQQEELLRETDELNERMQQSTDSEPVQESMEKLEQARQNVQQATDALRQNDASSALAAGSRAEEQFETMRDEFRKAAASDFEETVREMRQSARELEQNQTQLQEALANEPAEDSPGLRREASQDVNTEAMAQGQREKLGELLQQIRETVEQAESSEPLLAEKLYEAFRDAEQRQIDRQLENSMELQRRGMTDQAVAQGQQASEGLTNLRENLEEAAESVLGDPTEALQRALGELEQLSRNLESELDQQNPQRRSSENASESNNREPANGSQNESNNGADAGESDEGQPNASSQDAQNSQNMRRSAGSSGPESDSPSGNRPESSESNDRSQSPSQQNSSQPSGSPSESASDNSDSSPSNPSPSEGRGGEPTDRSGQASSSQQEGEQEGGRPQPDAGGDSMRQAGRQGLSQWAAANPAAAPFSGDGFREWSDGLREVEEILDDPELRSRAAQIRDRAREIRLEQRRHSKEPQWELVEEMIAAPLRELKADVTEELVRRSSSRLAPVPIDRDPVPDQFSRAVQKYYESLGSDR